MECFRNPSCVRLDESPEKAFLREEMKLSATSSDVQANSIKRVHLLLVSNTAGLKGHHQQQSSSVFKGEVSMRYGVA